MEGAIEIGDGIIWAKGHAIKQLNGLTLIGHILKTEFPRRRAEDSDCADSFENFDVIAREGNFVPTGQLGDDPEMLTAAGPIDAGAEKERVGLWKAIVATPR